MTFLIIPSKTSQPKQYLAASNLRPSSPLMFLALAHAAAAPAQSTQVFILPAGTTTLPDAAAGDLAAAARQYVDAALADDQKLVHLNHFSHHHFFVVLADKPTAAQVAEQLRRAGHTLHGQLKAEKIAEVFIEN